MLGKLWKQLLAIGVGLVGLLSGIAGISGWLKIEPESLLGLLISPFVVLVTWLFNEHAVYGWVIVLLGLCALAIVIQLVRLATRTEPASPAYLQYRSDHVYGVDCAWRWSYGQPDDIKWLCPICKSQLDLEGRHYFNSRTHSSLICRRCNKAIQEFSLDEDQVEDHFVKEIERVARTQYGLPLHSH